MEIPQILISICLGIGLAAAVGFRVFLPLLITGIFLRLGIGVPGITPENFWLSSNLALICFSVATIFEVLAYKIPIVDHFLDLFTTPTAISIGALIFSLFLNDISNPMLKYTLSIILGGGTAGLFQGATVLGRTISTKTTGGVVNPVYSLGELIMSFLISIFALLLPIFCAVILILGVIFVAFRYLKNKGKQKLVVR